jgi:hypothetical protein
VSAEQRRVFIHYYVASAEDAALARQLADRLRQEGFAVGGIRPVQFRIGTGGVRYFFLQDRDAARDLLVVGDAQLRQGGKPLSRGPRDFTHYDPKPASGTIEVWLASQ